MQRFLIKHVFAVMACLLVAASIAGADTIVLKNGTRIQTQGTWLDGDILKYFKDGAIAEGIPKDRVERIETDAPADRLPPPPSPPPAPVTGPKRVDLKARLAANFTARNAIETAGSATVSIHSAAGSGAGFFITAEGHILTNRHVIRGDEKKLADVDTKLRKAETQLKRMNEQLRQQQRRIDEMADQIATDPRYDSAHNQSVLNDARKKYRSNKAHYQRQRALFKEKARAHRQLKTRLLLQQTVEITFIDQSKLTASVVRISRDMDLALLKLEGYRTPFIRAGDIRNIARGEALFAIGNPLNFSHAVTAGVFSGRHRGMLMTSAPINPGNSGGPLVTENGVVVGINTQKMVGDGVEGIGFAIPISRAIAAFADVLKPHLPNR